MQEAVFFNNRNEFCCWLEENYKTADEIWLGYYKKSSGRRNLSWSESSAAMERLPTWLF